MQVLDFTLDDIDVFIGLCKKFYSSGATKRAFNEEITVKTFHRIMDRHENLWGKLFVVDGVPIGYAIISSYWCNEDGGNVVILDEIYIEEKERHKGYGNEFMKWMENEYKKDSVAITLYVEKDNHKAHRLYEQSGYVYGGFEQMIKYI